MTLRRTKIVATLGPGFVGPMQRDLEMLLVYLRLLEQLGFIEFK